MGKYEEYNFTIRPDDESVDRVAETLRNIPSLTEEEITPPQRITDEYWRDDPEYDLDRLTVDTNNDHAFIGGRTHNPTNGDLWQWLLFDRLDCGGMISLIHLFETDVTAAGRIFEWNGERYVDTTADLSSKYGDPLVEHSLGSGAIVADKIARETDITPARKSGLDVYWYGDDRFVPVQYLREGGKPIYQDTSGRRCWWFECDLSHRGDVQPVQ
ncbi:hypothetical protein ACOZ4N_17450 [Halorientalis pallida]|uniref:hypothetical protein n=1 Tax=Halorientalis pallida TaxID=2479928 RepID=UPI003C6EFD45